MNDILKDGGGIEYLVTKVFNKGSVLHKHTHS